MALSLKKGGSFVLPNKTADKNAKVIYHYTPGSYNAQKGLLLLQISSLESSNVVWHSIRYPEENQTLQYAMNLSPNMSVPVLEIDGNVVLNDSYDIHKYLLENYPGKGNALLSEEEKSIQEDFIQTNLKWDEYLFSYRRIPKFLGAAMHQIRLVELSKAVQQAVADDVLDKKLMDGRTVMQAYIDKVAQTRSLIRIGCDDDTVQQLAVRTKANDELMQDILKSADKLLAFHNLLLTDEDDKITSADVYLAVLLNRIEIVDGDLLKQVYADYPKIEKWWVHFNSLKESEALKVNTPVAKIMMLLSKGHKLILLAMGMLNPAPLPDDMEQEVMRELEKIMSEYCKVN